MGGSWVAAHWSFPSPTPRPTPLSSQALGSEAWKPLNYSGPLIAEQAKTLDLRLRSTRSL